MTINDIRKLIEIYMNGQKTYDEMCHYLLKQDTKLNNELLLLIFTISDSMESLALLSNHNKMRDCYVISRAIYETVLNILLITATDFESMKEMLDYTNREIDKESARSTATDSEALIFAFDGKQHQVAFIKNNPIKTTNPGSWTKHNISNRINLIDKKYGKQISRFLQLTHLTVYRTSTNIAHGTLYGMLQAMGLIHGKRIKDFTEVNMMEHNLQRISILLLTILQSVYAMVSALDKEVGLNKFEKDLDSTLLKFIEEIKVITEK